MVYQGGLCTLLLVHVPCGRLDNFCNPNRLASLSELRFISDIHFNNESKLGSARVELARF
jgi:hypothetical protein